MLKNVAKVKVSISKPIKCLAVESVYSFLEVIEFDGVRFVMGSYVECHEIQFVDGMFYMRFHLC